MDPRQRNLLVQPVSANNITAHLLVAIPREFPGARVWRRNVGVAVGLDTVRAAVGLIRRGSYRDAVELLLRRPITFGVPGESDIEGLLQGGRAVFIEVKSGSDRMREEQRSFMNMVIRAGGVYVIAHTVEEGLAGIRQAVGMTRDEASPNA